MEPSFAKLLVKLADADIKFVLVGGLAVTLQGYVRFTEDIDMLIATDTANVRCLLDTLSDFGQGFARELSVEDFSDEEGAIRIIEESEQCQLDIFTRISGRTYTDVIQDADSLSLQGRSVCYASKASLIAWKTNSLREKDHLDVLALKELIENPNAFD